MSWNRLRMTGSAVVVLALALITGCPQTDVLNTGNHEFFFKTVSVEDADWACVLMGITELWIKPADGTCSDSGVPCGDNTDCDGGACEGTIARDGVPSGLLQIVANNELPLANFKNQGQACEEFPDFGPGKDFSLQILSSGTYRIARLRVVQPALVDDSGTEIECSNYAAAIAELPFYQDSLVFHVGESEPNTLRLVINAAALAEQLEGDCVANLTTGITSVFKIE